MLNSLYQFRRKVSSNFGAKSPNSVDDLQIGVLSLSRLK